MSERRAKGLCYYCDEKFTPEHFQKHKKTQLYSMECDDEGEDSEEEGDIEENSEGHGKEVAQISSHYASPIVLVKKKDNTWRLCVDYRKTR